MYINWFTVLAQAFNFLLLLFILNKFLFKAIFRALEDRKKEIQGIKDSADKKILEAEAEKELFENKLKDFEAEKQKAKKEMLKQLEEDKSKRVVEIEKEVADLRKKFEKQMENEKQDVILSSTSVVKSSFIGLVNNFFKSISNETLESEVVKSFLSKIEILDADKIKNLNAKLKAGGSGVVNIATAFEINSESSSSIEKMLKSRKVEFSGINYSVNEELVIGIELKIESFVIGFNIKEAIESFKIELKNNL